MINNTKVEFHCHTRNSFDCEVSIKDRVNFYAANGFTHLVITDHDKALTKTDYDLINDCQRPIVVIPGIEISTHVGHVILLNCKRTPWINSLFFLVIWSKVYRSELYIPHPCRSGTGLLIEYVRNRVPTWYISWFLRHVKYVEVWNPRDSIKDKIGVNVNVLAQLENCIFVAASDSHYSDDVFTQGCPANGLDNSNPLVKRFFEEKVIAQDIVISLTLREFLRYIKSALRYLTRRL